MDHDNIYDVIVIGAGPAGSEFAYRAARQGFRVLVLEKDELDREKPCGGGIPAQEMIEFGRMPPKVYERMINKARVISPDNNMLEISGGKYSGATVKRSMYDHYLQKRAEKAGALVKGKQKVTEIRKKKGSVEVAAGDKKYSARLIADASGCISNIKGLPRHFDDKDIVATYHIWVRLPRKEINKRIGSCIEMYSGKDIIPQSYAWIFPKRDIVSVGLGGTMDMIKSKKLSLRKSLDNFIKRHPIASRKLKGARIVETGGGLISVGLAKKLYSENVIYLGDAGGFANPLHAGGIYQARKSSKIAAKYAKKFLRAKTEKQKTDALKGYDAEAREEFYEKNGKWDLKLRNLFWNDALLNIIVKEAKKNKNIKDAIGIILSMKESHEKAYRMLEKEMLDIIHKNAKEKVEKYRKIIGKEFRMFKDHRLDSFAKHSFFGEAKRLRVSLVLLACDIFGGNVKKAAKLAPVYELLHTASLVHDDIMDDAKTRRGRKTLHSLYGINNAIVTGDFLIGKTYKVLSKGFSGLSAKQKTDILAIIGNTTTECCYGQSMDLEFAELRRYTDIEDYLAMARLKTGSMIKGALMKGAVIANASSADVSVMGRIGLNIGTAFQIIDDSIDLLGNNSSKSLHNDLKQGKATPMLYHALKNSCAEQRKFLLSVIGNRPGIRDAYKVLDIYRETGAIEFAQKLSGEYVDRARKDLKKLRKVNKKALGVLKDVVDVIGYWSQLGK